MVSPSANAVVPKAWLRPSAAALVSFAVTGPTVTVRPEVATLAALRSSVARSKRAVPSSAVRREAADGDPAHSGHSVLRSRPIDN